MVFYHSNREQTKALTLIHCGQGTFCYSLLRFCFCFVVLFNYPWHLLWFEWPQSFEHLVTWSLVGDAVWGHLEAMALQEEVHHWGRAQSPISLPGMLVFENVSFQLHVPIPCLSLAPMSLHHDRLFSLWNHRPKYALYKLPGHGALSQQQKSD